MRWALGLAVVAHALLFVAGGRRAAVAMRLRSTGEPIAVERYGSEPGAGARSGLVRRASRSSDPEPGPEADSGPELRPGDGAPSVVRERSLSLDDIAALGNEPPRYPSSALHAGWEGTTLLSLTSDSHSLCASASLARSSGYRILDEAALEAARRWRLPEAGTRYEVPVAFRIE